MRRGENGWEISIYWHYFDFEAEIEKYVIWALTAGILIKAVSFDFE